MITVNLRALFVKAVVNKWSEEELMLLFPDVEVSSVKRAMIQEYNQHIAATTLGGEYRAFLDKMTITMEVQFSDGTVTI